MTKRLGLMAILIASMSMTHLVSADAAETGWLRSTLSLVPLAALDDLAQTPIVANAVNLSEARSLGLTDHDTKPEDLVQRLLVPEDGIRALAAWRFRDDKSLLENRLGVPLGHLTTLAGYGPLPSDTALWVFDDDTSARTVFDGLTARGFSPLADQMLANGQPMEMNIKASSPGDPWRGALGKSSVVARKGRMLMQAWKPELIEAAQQATETSSIMTVPPVNTVVTGLEATASDGAKIIHVFLATPEIGGSDPAELLALKDGKLPDMKQIRGKTEDQSAQDQATGLPPYAIALLADIETPGKSRGVAVVFAYPDCGLAKEGASRFATRWKSVPLASAGDGSTFASLTGADVAIRTVQAADGTCAAAAVATVPVTGGGASFENRPWDTVTRAIFQRDFVAATITSTGSDR